MAMELQLCTLHQFTPALEIDFSFGSSSSLFQ